MLTQNNENITFSKPRINVFERHKVDDETREAEIP